MKKDEVLPLAYSGKYVELDSKTYQLTPEAVKGGCVGCDRVTLATCHKDRTEEGYAPTRYCRQGFILKKVNV